MAETIMPCFDRFPTEGNLIGRLLAGYGELELEMCACVAAATNDFDGAVKALFGKRGEAKRIKSADSLMKKDYSTAGLRDRYELTINNMDWCRCIRNQYAHCHWYDTTSDGLCFLNLEDTAKIKGIIGPLTAHRYPIDSRLLSEQENFFKYVQKCFWHLAEAYAIATGKTKKGMPLFDWPKLIGVPVKHN